MNRIAIIAGGWHYPYHFYEKVSKLKVPEGWESDLFVIGHRDPDLEIVSKEKKDILNGFGNHDNFLMRMDEVLYSRTIKKSEIEQLGFDYSLEPNNIGDFYFFNQWAEKNDWTKYDMFLFMHDDTFMLEETMIVDVINKDCNLYYFQNEVDKKSEWLFLTACGDQLLCPRASFAFFDKKLIEKLGGKFSMQNVKLDREGLVDTPGTGLSGTADWNTVSRNFTNFMQQNGWQEKMLRMSPYYRISKYCLEGERGFSHIVKVSTQLFHQGCKDYSNYIQQGIYEYN
tara:strand:- start:12210 stop:13061 length:852 start_codon:yes stop_codon:yes gene_type:complete